MASICGDGVGEGGVVGRAAWVPIVCIWGSVFHCPGLADWPILTRIGLACWVGGVGGIVLGATVVCSCAVRPVSSLFPGCHYSVCPVV